MTSAAPGARSAIPTEPGVRRFLRATEIDTRMIGMIFALALIWVGFNIYTWFQTGEGVFLTPRNLWNLTVQTSSIAVMATGMVLVIVMRHIDLSVGSIVAFVANVVGVTQVYLLPQYLGLGSPLIWIIAVVLAHGRRPAWFDRRPLELGARRARLRRSRFRALREPPEAGAIPLSPAPDVGGGDDRGVRLFRRSGSDRDCQRLSMA
jgi:hypothetical protein